MKNKRATYSRVFALVFELGETLLCHVLGGHDGGNVAACGEVMTEEVEENVLCSGNISGDRDQLLMIQLTQLWHWTPPSGRHGG